MSLSLYVDGDRWRAHLDHVRDTRPAIVPVVKGNGYGFGIPRLAGEAARLGLDTVAVGMYEEVGPARGSFPGDVMVLTPWRPFDRAALFAPHVIHTVGRLEDLEALAARTDGPRVVLERMTSMRRHGFSASGLREAGELLAGTPGSPRPERVGVEGVALHLPISSGSHLTEVERLMTDVVAADLPTRRIFVSHLTDAETALLRQRYPDYEFRPRIGTDLWLGERGALRVRATVLDVHPVERGDVFGYRSRTAPKAGHILIVSGGTAHGIGLEAPTGGATLKDRAARVAKGGLDAAGFVRSPYTIGGKLRLFAEPPHMQASMLFLPHGAPVPEVGDEVEVRVRFTATSFDATVIS
ncbi:alanine racemase [Nocardioides mesophilus]|uniref:Alanine racemase n=1 Tax=Nocardioides mesophilus TaxID=433659 RepID=A0A7G9RFP2_9ACTN|nr:alanine racemase [Nocardioides mesophilus]QNN54417.1 alanine racemase [Nocardioides mesophilus]